MGLLSKKSFRIKKYRGWYRSWNHIWVIAWIRNPQTVTMNSWTALVSVNSWPEYCSSCWFLPWKLEGREGLSLIWRWIYAALSFSGWTYGRFGPIMDQMTSLDQKFAHKLWISESDFNQNPKPFSCNCFWPRLFNKMTHVMKIASNAITTANKSPNIDCNDEFSSKTSQ